MHTPESITGTVLIVDREDQLSRQVSIFTEAGLHVLTATTAQEGLAVARAQHPDLVVAEVMLDRPDAGFVLGYDLKTDPELAGIPLVLLSSIFQRTGIIFDLNSPESRQWIKADAYLEQPVTPDRLLAKVRSLLKAAGDNQHDA